MRNVPVGAYSVVMATGIIAVAARENGYTGLSDGFWAAATALYVVLLAVGAVLPGHVRAALGDPGRGFTVLTFVAATDVLASLLGGLARAVLLAVAVVILVLLGRPLAHRIRAWPHSRARGNWLLAVVALQSVVVAAALLGSTALAMAAVAVWCVGLALYVLIAGWLLARLRHHLAADEFTPDWWILMGALAISALAGAHLLADLPGDTPLVEPVRVVSLLALAVGTGTIAPLAVLDARRLVGAAAHWYELARWAMVFPLGMCSAASHALALGTGWVALERLSQVLFWCALVAWACTAAGALHHLVGWARSRHERA